jgi:hypothetical protein
MGEQVVFLQGMGTQAHRRPLLTSAVTFASFLVPDGHLLLPTERQRFVRWVRLEASTAHLPNRGEIAFKSLVNFIVSVHSAPSQSTTYLPLESTDCSIAKLPFGLTVFARKIGRREEVCTA